MHKVRTPPRADIRQRREAAGLTMAKLGRILGVDTSTVYHWEHGHFRIAQQYERDLAELFDSLEAGGDVPEPLRERVADRVARVATLRKAGVHVPQPRTLARMKKALAFIQRFATENGYTPTYSDIGRALGAPSARSTGRRMVSLLAKTGYLEMTADSPQFRGNFELTRKGEELA